MSALRLTLFLVAVAALLAAFIGIQSQLGSPRDAKSAFKAHYDAGLAYLADGLFSDAINELTEAYHLNPSSAAALHKLGWAYIQAKQYAKGESYQLQALTLRLDCALCAFKIGTSKMRQHDFAASAEWYGKAVALKPEWALGRFYHARSLATAKQPDAALEEVRAALKLDPSLGQAKKLLAKLANE